MSTWSSDLLITTGEHAKRQIDVESNGVEGGKEGEEEILDEVAGQNTTCTSTLGNLGQINIRKKRQQQRQGIRQHKATTTEWRILLKTLFRIWDRPQTRIRRQRRSKWWDCRGTQGSSCRANYLSSFSQKRTHPMSSRGRRYWKWETR